MMNKKTQQGVGLVEVLVSLLLLSIVVLGFVALQVKAMEATHESSNNTKAMTLARGLAERMRVNPEGQNAEITVSASESYKGKDAQVKDCGTEACTAKELAAYDFDQIREEAREQGMSVAVLQCPGGDANSLPRKCVYVAWDDTTATNGNTDNIVNGTRNCTNGTSYVPGSKCVMMELYNYS